MLVYKGNLQVFWGDLVAVNFFGSFGNFAHRVSFGDASIK